MKKCLILMLVLGLAASANAGLTFTINGEPQPPEIWLRPSEAVELDLELYEGSINGYDLTYVLSNAQAEFIWDGYVDINQNEYGATTFPAPFDMAGGFVIKTPQLVQISGSQFFNPALQAPQTIMLDLVLHCLEETDVILDVIVSGTTEVDGIILPLDEVIHTLTIHQFVPEPMTIALLGLGGLFALRRKK